MTGIATELLMQWLSNRLTPDQSSWFHTQLQKIAQSNSDRELHITLGMIPRKLGRADLLPSAEELSAADKHAPGWNPTHWSIDSTARIAVICHLASLRPEQFDDTLTDLIRNADLAESIALYSGVALYPQSSQLDNLIGEGLRTNIRSVFEAIAHNNPYPATHFDENRWNHMVLKALFIDSTLAPIYGLDKRANPELANILCDYANERWAAGRLVTFELWRCVGPFATGKMITDLERAAATDNQLEKQAALLALSDAPDQQGHQVLNSHPQVACQIASGELTWNTISENARASNA